MITSLFPPVSSSVTEPHLLLLQTTVHGQCLTDYTVNSKLDSATAVTLSRDLSHCDGFQSREAPSSPLALLQRMVRPLGANIRGTPGLVCSCRV